MAMTPDSVNRTDDASGDAFGVFTDGATKHYQGVAKVNDDGGHAQIESWYATGATAEENVNIKASAGRLFQLIACSEYSSDVWLQLFDEADATPSTNPVMRVLLPANSSVMIDLGDHGKAFSNGILVAPSSTLAAYTGLTSNSFAYACGYK